MIWAKPNPMPESYRDRYTKAQKYIFMMTKRPWYYWDQEAIREPELVPGTLAREIARQVSRRQKDAGRMPPEVSDSTRIMKGERFDISRGRNARTVWAPEDTQGVGGSGMMWSTSWADVTQP